MPAPARPAPGDDTEDSEPGLARQRTDLAWTRTAISWIALGTAMLHTSTIVGVLVIGAGATIWLMGHLSARSAQGADHRPEGRRTAQFITAATTLTAVVALALTLLAPGDGYR